MLTLPPKVLMVILIAVHTHPFPGNPLL